MDVHNPLGLVFPTIDGGLIHPNHWSKRDFKAALKRAGLPATVRVYVLRHSMATLALEAGIHPKVVSERLGHSTTQLTLDTYSHVTPTMQAKASEELAALIYPTATPVDAERYQSRPGRCVSSADEYLPVLLRCSRYNDS